MVRVNPGLPVVLATDFGFGLAPLCTAAGYWAGASAPSPPMPLAARTACSEYQWRARFFQWANDVWPA